MDSSDPNGDKAIVPKSEILDFNFPPDTLHSRHVGDNVASSSGSNIRPFFKGMGFLPSLVDKVVEEKGEDNVDLLLETLFAYSALQNPTSESSDSLDSLFDDKEGSSPPEMLTAAQPKEEPDADDGVNSDKRASLLMMKFSVNEVEYAINKLGEDAPINELVDFISAAQIAQELDKDADDRTPDDEVRTEDTNNEALFGTMEKTLRLLEMGFSDNEVSSAIEKYGPEAPLSQLADAIFADQVAGNCVGGEKVFNHTDECSSATFGTLKVKTEDLGSDAGFHSKNINAEQSFKGKRPKQELSDDCLDAVSQSRNSCFWENTNGKRLKQVFVDTTWVEEKVDPKITQFGTSNPFKANPCKSVNRMVAKPPYFFYGNMVNVSHESWAKISQFLYALEPEFVNTQFFSALSRKEGYVHNLPTENRFHILPKSPMTIEDAIPHTKKWWPSWDTRKQITCIIAETSGISQLCDRLGRMLTDSRGLLSPEQQRDILHHCRMLNLLWVGPYKLAPVDPEHIERILGYPESHTEAAEYGLIERLKSLKYCFQTDTLAYHLSVLKTMFPEGLTVLSLYSGIGGAEVALNRLGIHLKGVVSVESSETKRRILRKWWQNSGQTGELVQIAEIQSLTSNKIESLIKKFGAFDFIICQNPCTHFPSYKMAAEDDTPTYFDFSLFYEFVRILQRVRSMVERKR